MEPTASVLLPRTFHNYVFAGKSWLDTHSAHIKQLEENKAKTVVFIGDSYFERFTWFKDAISAFNSSGLSANTLACGCGGDETPSIGWRCLHDSKDTQKPTQLRLDSASLDRKIAAAKTNYDRAKTKGGDCKMAGERVRALEAQREQIQTILKKAQKDDLTNNNGGISFGGIFGALSRCTPAKNVVVFGGLNDVLKSKRKKARKCIPKAISALSLIHSNAVKKLPKETKLHFIRVLVLPSWAKSADKVEAVSRINAAIDKFADGKRVFVSQFPSEMIKVLEPSTSGDRGCREVVVRPELLCQDGVHLNGKGYQAFAGFLKKTVA